jgi:hypothetical protein
MAQGYINDRTTDYHSLKSHLMGHGISPQRSDHFDVLNHHLRRGLVTPGAVGDCARCPIDGDLIFQPEGA